MWRNNMNFTIGDGQHTILAQYDENGNLVAGNHTHQHTWDNGNTGGWYGGTVPNGNVVLNRDYVNADIVFNTSDIMIENRHLTKVIEDMAILLKMIVEKYDLHEVKKLVEETEVATWAHDAKYREDLVEEKKEHLDEKLFEI